MIQYSWDSTQELGQQCSLHLPNGETLAILFNLPPGWTDGEPYRSITRGVAVELISDKMADGAVCRMEGQVVVVEGYEDGTVTTHRFSSDDPDEVQALREVAGLTSTA